MGLRLNRRAFEYAKSLVLQRNYMYDERDAWSEHQPTAEDENEFIHLHGIDEYARWYLGINDDRAKNTKAAYEFPYGDFKVVHRCGILSAESRAAQYKHQDIASAVAHLHGMIDAQPRAIRERAHSRQ